MVKQHDLYSYIKIYINNTYAYDIITPHRDVCMNVNEPRVNGEKVSLFGRHVDFGHHDREQILKPSDAK